MKTAALIGIIGGLSLTGCTTALTPNPRHTEATPEVRYIFWVLSLETNP